MPSKGSVNVQVADNDEFQRKQASPTSTKNQFIVNVNRNSKQNEQAATVASIAKPADKSLARHFAWHSFVVAIWAAIAGAILIWQGIRIVCFARFIKRSRQCSNARVARIVKQLRVNLRIKRRVNSLVIDGPTGPAVMGFFRPTVLLPAEIVRSRTDEQLSLLIAHELIHIRRGDLWWALLQSISGSLFWFHPLIRIAVNSTTVESERSCDEETVASLDCEPAEYANNLLEILELKHRFRYAPALPGVKPVEITSARLERVMKLRNGSYRRTPWWTWMTLVVCCSVFLPGAALVWGQAPDKAPADTTVLKNTYRLPLLPKPQPSSEDDRLEMRTYDISKIVESLRNQYPEAKRQMLELHLLSRLESYPPRKGPAGDKPGTEILGGKLIAARCPRNHKLLKQKLDQMAEHGIFDIVVELQHGVGPKQVWEGLDWQLRTDATLQHSIGDLRRRNPVANMVVQVSHEAVEINSEIAKIANVDDAVHPASMIGASSRTDNKIEFVGIAKKRPVWSAILDDVDVAELIQTSESNSEFEFFDAPTLVTFDGMSGKIVDTQHRPFVTGVTKIEGEANAAAHQPQISIVANGTEWSILPELVNSNELRVDIQLLKSTIEDV
ncbi:MAG: M56 family metallopeptidase, partial [Planctomycetota bacterium]